VIHEVRVRCSCDDIDHCIVACYLADVRRLYFEIGRIRSGFTAEQLTEQAKALLVQVRAEGVYAVEAA
jgi:hypothetical protein